jgi:DNA-binding response OmpR family regulator
MDDRHVALIVEDDPHIADIEKELVTSMGHKWLHATSLEDVRNAITAGGYCYVLLDMQIPADAVSRPAVVCGETALRLLRRASPQRTDDGKHVLPILIVSGYSRDPEFVSKMFEMDANGFISKPFGERIEATLAKIHTALERAGREEHSACSAAVEARGAREPARAGSERPPSAAAVHLVIDGSVTASRTNVLVNGIPVPLQDSTFSVLLRLVAFHLRSPGEWSPADKVGTTTRAWATSRLRTAFKCAVPPGFEVVEVRKGVGCRLNPSVVVERVAWDALRTHGEAAVRKLAVDAKR